MHSCDVILHPTDFSEESNQAFELACSMARDQFASLVVVHVLPQDCEQQLKPEVDLDNDQSPVIQKCRDGFRRMRAVAPDIPISFRIVFGNTVSAILNTAFESNAELIVIASHRHTQFHLQLHGSVAEGLLRQTHCPVVVVRQPQNKFQRHSSGRSLRDGVHA